jgi:hypothetical protein
LIVSDSVRLKLIPLDPVGDLQSGYVAGRDLGHELCEHARVETALIGAGMFFFFRRQGWFD